MDKNIKINLGGILFNIDEEAYIVLRKYLQEIDLRLRNMPGGAETIEDIESRIAEIFQSQKGLTGVISKDNVEYMISVLGKPEAFDNEDEEKGEKDSSRTSAKRNLYRNPDDAIIGGVCGGLGANLKIETVWIRILFIVFAFFFGIGLFVYIALWIALPSATNDARKLELYGNYAFRNPGIRSRGLTTGNNTGSAVGIALNETFRAIGKVFFIIFRVFMIAIGVLLVLTGFLSLAAFIMVFLFKYPGAFSTDAAGFDLSYFPDFLNYVVSPSLVPWITILIVLVVALPLLAIIYGGVKMIFWFRAKDGVFLLIGFVLWAISAAVLSIILFNEGISFAETAKTTTHEMFKETPDTLFIVSGNKLADLQFDKELSIPDEEYNVYISDEKKEIYIRTYLNISTGEDNRVSVDIKKRSAGRSRQDAMKKAGQLNYNYEINSDTLTIDEYFTLPNGTKWSFDNVGISLKAPEGTVIYLDTTVESQVYSFHDDYFISDPVNRYWLLTGKGLSYIDKNSRNN